MYLGISSNTIIKEEEKRINLLIEDKAELLDSVQNLQLKVLEMRYFSLKDNDDALAYYDHLKMEDPSGYISDKLLETNEPKG